jgi:HSP20 family molecular chaperone IbpA
MSPQGKSGPDMSELFERFSFNRGFFTLSRQIWRPATDIVETQDAFVLRLEVAGVPEESIEVTADGDRLIVRGCRREVRRPDASPLSHAGTPVRQVRARLPLPLLARQGRM